jgi:histidinol phosphatase-like enzyme
MNYSVFFITNQAGIAEGLFSEADFVAVDLLEAVRYIADHS